MARTGVKCKAYVRTAGSFGSPTFTELTLIDDATLDAVWARAMANTRATIADLGVRTSVDLSFTGTVRQDDSDTAYAALLAAWISSSGTVDVMILNGAQSSNGVVGVRFVGEVTKFTEPQGRGVVLYRSFEIKPTVDSTNYPQSVLVAAGVPGFTTIT
jgi:hypothetical protein